MTTISFRTDDAIKQKLDFIATSQQRDRSFIINQAIDSFLSLNEWQLEHIEKGLRQAQLGEFASEEEVKSAFSKWKK